MAQRVVDQVRHGLKQEVAVARHRDPGRVAEEHDLPIALVPVRLIELGRVPGEGAEVDRRESFPGRLRLDPGDAEQGRERGKETIGLADGRFHRFLRVPAEPARVAELLQAGAEPGEGRLEIVRDVVGHRAGSRP